MHGFLWWICLSANGSEHRLSHYTLCLKVSTVGGHYLIAQYVRSLHSPVAYGLY